jgi:hypothetical protein
LHVRSEPHCEITPRCAIARIFRDGSHPLGLRCPLAVASRPRTFEYAL